MKISIFPKKVTYIKKIPEKKNLWVFILAGQSNMVGGGVIEAQDTIPSERVLTITDKGKLILAKEPIHFYNKDRAGLGCGLTFGKSLIEQIPDSISVLLLPTAIGSTSIEEWLHDAKFQNVRLMSNFKSKLELGQNYGVIKGILWHQGESDAVQEKIGSYRTNLKKLFQQFRIHANNPTLPILTAELGSFSIQADLWKAINTSIEANANEDSYTACFSTSDLKDRGDRVHFNSESQRIMGLRFAQAYLDTFYKGNE